MLSRLTQRRGGVDLGRLWLLCFEHDVHNAWDWAFIQ
jgi:hypothetical protein